MKFNAILLFLLCPSWFEFFASHSDDYHLTSFLTLAVEFEEEEELLSGTISLKHRFGSAGTPYCLDIEGSVEDNSLDCRFIKGQSCRGNVDQMFAYDRLDNYIYSTTLQGGKITTYYSYLGDGSISLGNFDANDKLCGRNVTSTQGQGQEIVNERRRGGCLSLVGKFEPGSKLGLAYCAPGAVYQTFRFNTSSGQIHIAVPPSSDSENTVVEEEEEDLCVGMNLNLYPTESSGEFSRVIETMDCNTADPRSITWVIDPMPTTTAESLDDDDLDLDDDNNNMTTMEDGNFTNTTNATISSSDEEEEDLPDDEVSELVEIVNKAGGGSADHINVAEKEKKDREKQGTAYIDEPLPEFFGSSGTRTTTTTSAATTLVFITVLAFLY